MKLKKKNKDDFKLIRIRKESYETIIEYANKHDINIYQAVHNILKGKK